MAVVTMVFKWRIQASPGNPAYNGSTEVSGNFDPDAKEQDIRDALETKARKEIHRSMARDRLVEIIDYRRKGY